MVEFRYTEFGQIPAEWDLKIVDDIKSSEKYSMSMGPFGSNITVDNFISEGVPVIRGVNLNFDRFVDGEFVFMSNEKADKLKSGNCKSGDLVFTHRDTIGQVGLIPFFTKYERYIISQSGMKLTVDSRKVDSLFAFYFFKSRYGQFQLLKNESQVGVPSISTPLTSLKEIEIPVPPLMEQQSIASILSSLDDKIDLLHRQNKTLEALAETLFRQWFVEEAEEGWETGKLGDYASVTTGKGLKRHEFIDNGIYPVLGANGEIGRTNNYLTEDRLILTGRVGTLGKVIISEDKVWISDNVLIVKPHAAIYFYPIYFNLKRTEFENLNVGSTQPLVTQTDLKNIDFSLPSGDILKSFENHCSVYYQKKSRNDTQIRTLTRLRDTLLPRLMSGEVRVIN